MGWYFRLMRSTCLTLAITEMRFAVFVYSLMFQFFFIRKKEFQDAIPLYKNIFSRNYFSTLRQTFT